MDVDGYIGSLIIKYNTETIVGLIFAINVFGLFREVEPLLKLYTVEPVYSGHLGTQCNCPYYRDVLISQVLLYAFILHWDHNYLS